VPRYLTCRTAVTLSFSLLLSISALPLGSSPAAAAGGSTLVSIVNQYRATAGVPSVALDAAVDQIAVERGNQLAAARQLGHDLTYVANRLAQYGVCWTTMGEIVAYNTSGSHERFVQQWYGSDGHRAIMLGPTYTHAGGSVSRGGDGRYYAVMIFIRSCSGQTTPSAPAPTGDFTDISTSPFVDDIEWLVDAGITNGCGGGRFCPSSVVTRDQMASFLSRAEGLAAASSDYFVDDAGSTHEADINRIAQAAITNGCASHLYCPGSQVRRDHMASFLVRAMNLPAAGRDYFWDDAGSQHEDAINRLAAAGITNGCGGGRYCPLESVSREQMSAFLHRAYD
jgi:hypothetical protein